MERTMTSGKAAASGSDKPTLEAGIACEALCAMENTPSDA